MVLQGKRDGNLDKLEDSVVARGATVKHRASNVQKIKSKYSCPVPQRWHVKAQTSKYQNLQSTIEKKRHQLMVAKALCEKIEKVDEKKIFARKKVSFAPNLISDIFFYQGNPRRGGAGNPLKGVRAKNYPT